MEGWTCIGRYRRSSRRSWQVPEMTGPVHETDHLGCRMDRQTMRGAARPGRDIGCHLTSPVQLPIRCCGEQRDHQVFQCDHSNLKLHQLGICQRRVSRLHQARSGCGVEGAAARIALALPSRKRHSPQGCAVRGFQLSVRHGHLAARVHLVTVRRHGTPRQSQDPDGNWACPCVRRCTDKTWPARPHGDSPSEVRPESPSHA